MGNVSRFEDLTIWQEARILIKEIYSDFHAIKDPSFTGQVHSAGISIMNNIAEGFERRTDNDFARFLDIAKASCGEVRSMYYIAEDLKYINSQVAISRRDRSINILKGIASLSKHLRKDKNDF